MNQSKTVLTRKGLVAAMGPPACPGCGHRLEFGSDRLGRTTQSCGCGHRALVSVRRRRPTAPIGIPE